MSLLWCDWVSVTGPRRHNWKSAQVVNSHLVCDPTIRQLGFDLPQQQLCLLNRFRTEQGHCGTCRKKTVTYRHWSVSLWRDPDDVSHCRILSLTRLNGGLSRLHSADEDAVSWLTSYGSWNAYEKKTGPWYFWPFVIDLFTENHYFSAEGNTCITEIQERNWQFKSQASAFS